MEFVNKSYYLENLGVIVTRKSSVTTAATHSLRCGRVTGR